MGLANVQRLDLVVATLATYNYPLDKAWALREALAAAGLADPARVAGRSAAGLAHPARVAGRSAEAMDTELQLARASTFAELRDPTA